MADKQYAQTIERALNAEIAALVAQQPSVESAKRRERTPVAPPAPAPAPIAPAQAAPGASGPPPSPAPSMDDEQREIDEALQREEAYGSASAPAPQRAVAPPPAPASAAAPLPTTHATVANLDQRIGRLMQVRDWIQEDGDIARLIDTVIGKQVQSSERRQARLTVVLNVIFLLAGWALSLVASPDHLRTLFH